MELNLNDNERTHDVDSQNEACLSCLKKKTFFLPVVLSPMWPKFLQTPVDLYRSNQNREESTISRSAHFLFSDTLTVIFTARVGTSHIQGVFNILYDEN